MSELRRREFGAILYKKVISFMTTFVADSTICGGELDGAAV